MANVEKSLEKKSNENKKISKILVYKIIKYSDINVAEKVQKIEEVNKVKFSIKRTKKFAYMNLFI